MLEFLNNAADEKLTAKIKFIVELDKLKEVVRQTKIYTGLRHENSAEHSWHLSMMVLLFQDDAKQPVDLLKSLKMALIHDVVEIIAGDIFAFSSPEKLKEKIESEKEAAKTLFAQLPEPYSSEFLTLWKEYEEGISPEAQYVSFLDRLQPFLSNYLNKGYSWKYHEVNKQSVSQRMMEKSDVSPRLQNTVNHMIQVCDDHELFSNITNH